MKNIILFFCVVPVLTFANTPSTSCPTGYIALDEEYITVATTCPSGTISVGTAESCLGTTTNGECYMYTPVGMSFTDDSGTYEFTDVCPMSD